MEDISEKYAVVQKGYTGPVKRYCQMLDLITDHQAIDEYIRLHNEEFHWREIRDGIKEIGILEMEIYIAGNRLFMVVETVLDFDWDSAFEDLSKMPRQQEWEDLVATFQNSAATTSSTKWTLMQRIFYLYDQ